MVNGQWSMVNKKITNEWKKPYQHVNFLTCQLIVMIKNFFKIAWKNLFRNKGYSSINIFGLTVGITCFLLIVLYIFDELTFDRFHKQAGNIYRVVEHKTSPEGKESKVAPIAYNISTHALKDFPEVERIARISMLGRDNISD